MVVYGTMPQPLSVTYLPLVARQLRTGDGMVSGLLVIVRSGRR